MKRIIETDEASTLEQLLGENVLIFCLNYIYTGKLIGVNAQSVVLEEPSIVYETGPYNQAGYRDAQRLHVQTWNVSISAIESFGKSK